MNSGRLRNGEKLHLLTGFLVALVTIIATIPLLDNHYPSLNNLLPAAHTVCGHGVLRQLGLGSSLLSDTSSTFRDRYGDIQLEANFEYRFPITTMGGVKVNSAIFADMGNIWNLKNQCSKPEQ